jgi:uncharacterized membrane protein YphA (DoxX/SURF4 family)
MLSSMFITGGADALLRPETKVSPVEDVVPKVTSKVSGLPEDPVQLIRLNGALQLIAGILLAMGRLPRLAALALAVSLVPTTAAAHRFWEETDKSARKAQQIHFFKNLSMLGGLLLAALDTEGRPGLAWRTRHAVEHAEAAAHRTRREARLAAKAAKAGARARLAA